VASLRALTPCQPKVGGQALLPLWLSLLPLNGDVEEAKVAAVHSSSSSPCFFCWRSCPLQYVHNMLCDFVERNNKFLLQNGQALPKIASGSGYFGGLSHVPDSVGRDSRWRLRVG
jgi:hypothetical protein